MLTAAAPLISRLVDGLRSVERRGEAHLFAVITRPIPELRPPDTGRL